MTSRRDFVKGLGTGLVGATIVVVPSEAISEDVPAEDNCTTIIWTGDNSEGHANEARALAAAIVSAGLVTSHNHIKVKFGV